MTLNFENISKAVRYGRIFRLLKETAEERQEKIYIVGGWVRNMLLGIKSKDIDFMIMGNVFEFARHFASKTGKNPEIVFFKNFGTVNLKTAGYEIEFVGARKESYLQDSRNPLVSEGSFEDDLSRRDFTVNALAVSLNKEDFLELIDLFHGLDDLEDKILRTPSDPDQTFSDDPLRMMRAIRFATQLNFRIEQETFDSICRNVQRLQIVSPERISDELNKIISANLPSTGFLLMYETGILQLIFPELVDLKGTETVDNKSHKDNFLHTLQVLDNVAETSDNLWLRWAALLHDIGKPQTKQYDEENGWTFHGHEVVGSKMVTDIFRRFRLPLNEKLKFVKKLVFLHLRPIALTKEEVTDSAFRRLIVEAGEDLDELLLLCKADITSKNPYKVSNYRSKFDEVAEKILLVQEKDRLRNWENPVKGELIMKTFGLKPSKEVGMIKEAVKEAILEGTINNNFEEAYRFMINFAEKLGLYPVD
ncbi:MAG TPA: HD domain-containing protein [Bacteroidia bacterium]|nr:HD domain-containing protein [Bacteroidia bacterium]HRS57911.1 HD domain-containing protein [Bacteroidia bacterium]HRU68280.1 HD domain-containing protein [Bacteroidia bacterium]